jgi:DNA repair exonuclease SbcCD nuclease subunit
MKFPTINKSKIAIFSDLHLGIHNNSHKWHDIALDWISWFKEELKKENIKDIIFCGDWHHNRSEISVQTLHISSIILDELNDFNIIALNGNHDIYFKYRIDVNSMSIYKGWKNIHIIDELTSIDKFGKIITFCPWNAPVNNIPKSDILFGHFELESFKMNTCFTCIEGIKIKDLINKANLVISGHFHRRQEKQLDETKFLYIGNPFQMEFGDIDDDKGFYILDIETSKYTFIKNTLSPQYKKIPLSELVAHKNIDETIKCQFHNNFVKLLIDRNVSHEHLNIIEQKLNLLHPQFLEIDYNKNYAKNSNAGLESDTLNAIDIPEAIREFINMLDISNKPKVIDFTLKLYQQCQNEKN